MNINKIIMLVNECLYTRKYHKKSIKSLANVNLFKK